MAAITPTSTEQVAIAAIVVEERAREEYGSIMELAESIGRVGLIHPIVLDANNRLVAGERRLRACRFLQWELVPVRRYGELTPSERLDIEIEENARRKNLTPLEESQAIARLAALAREVAKEETRGEATQVFGLAPAPPLKIQRTPPLKPARGPAPTPGSLRDVARRIGVNEATVRRAEKHVEVVEAHPELADLPQSEALRRVGPLGDPHERIRQFAEGQMPAFVAGRVQQLARAFKDVEEIDPALAARYHPARGRDFATARMRRMVEWIQSFIEADTSPAPPTEKAPQIVAGVSAEWARVLNFAHTSLLPLDTAALVQGMTPDGRRGARDLSRKLRAWLDALDAALDAEEQS